MKNKIASLTKMCFTILLLTSVIFFSSFSEGKESNRKNSREMKRLISSIKEHTRISVESASTTSFQQGSSKEGPIELSIDGNKSTIYHSSWSNTTFPVSLTYNFKNVSYIDYLVYHPRIGSTNGNIKKFKLYVATQKDPKLTLYNSYDFGGSSSPSLISFSPALEKPTQIKFVVESGVGDNGSGFVSCAEMEFYKKNKENFDYKAIFTDSSCTELKPDISEKKIQTIKDPFIKELALRVYEKDPENEFRIQSYKAYKDPQFLAQQNKTGILGLRDNPTGIYAHKGEEIIVLTGDSKGQTVSLFIQDVNNNISGSYFALLPGLNKITSDKTGLMYIMYYTPTGTEPDVKINIASGSVNGYFDSQKHSKDDWTRLLNKATFNHFDVIGKYASLTFETEAFRQYTPDGLLLMNKFDNLVFMEQDFMGLFKYDKAFTNRAYFQVSYIPNLYMYSNRTYTGYNKITQKEILNPDLLTTSGCWGPAHEMGHSLQTNPGFNWVGMTEVSNNVLSMYVQTSWKNKSRLIKEHRYEAAWNSLLKKQVPYNKSGNEVFEKLVPLWQIKLYMHDVLVKTDFYKDLYEAIRNQKTINTSVLTEGYYQLEFVKTVCDLAKLDLTDFFEAWGFLTEINEMAVDYRITRFIIKKSQIDAVKEHLKQYPKPKHDNIYDITDENIQDFMQ